MKVCRAWWLVRGVAMAGKSKVAGKKAAKPAKTAAPKKASKPAKAPGREKGSQAGCQTRDTGTGGKGGGQTGRSSTRARASRRLNASTSGGVGQRPATPPPIAAKPVPQRSVSAQDLQRRPNTS